MVVFCNEDRACRELAEESLSFLKEISQNPKVDLASEMADFIDLKPPGVRSAIGATQAYFARVHIHAGLSLDAGERNPSLPSHQQNIPDFTLREFWTR